MYKRQALVGLGLLLARPMPLRMGGLHEVTQATPWDELFICLLYTSDAADERSSVDLGGRRIIKKKKNTNYRLA